METPQPGSAPLPPTPVFNQAVWNALPAAVAILSPEGRITAANLAWSRLGRAPGPGEGEAGADFWEAQKQAARAGDPGAQHALAGIEAVQTGRRAGFEAECTVPSPAGPQWLALRATPLGDGSGAVLLLGENITPRRQAELAERDRSDRMLRFTQLALDRVAEGFFWANAAGRFVNVNETAGRQTGYSRAEILNLSAADLCPDITAANWPDHWRESQRRGTFSVEGRWRKKSGAVFPAEISINFVALGEEALAFIAVRDTTERKLAEDEMFRSNDMLRAILDSIPVRVFWKDTASVFQGCNQAFAQDAGCQNPGELIGTTDHDAPWKGNAEAYRTEDLTVMKTLAPKLNFEEFLQRADGQNIWVKVSKVPLFDREGRVSGVLGAYEDITERKQFDKILQQQARGSAFEAEVGLALSENVPLPLILQHCAEAMVRHLGAALARVWTLNHEQRVLELRASAGLSSQLDGEYARVPLGQWNIGLIAQEGKPHLTNDLDGNPRVQDHEWDRNWDRDWVRREDLVSFAGYPLMVEDRVEGVLGFFSRQKLQDHTLKVLATVARAAAQVIARHRVELALRLSEKRLSTFFRACPVGVSITRPTDARFIDVNETLVKMLGYSREELLARTALELGIWAEMKDREGLMEIMRAQGRVQQYKVRLRPKSGVICTMLIAAELIHLEGGEHLLAIYTDITASEQQNEELRRAKEAADSANRAKSAFLANMSHEIRTPMNAILGYAQLLQRDPALPAASKDNLNIINRSGQHLLALIEDVLEMSKIEAGRVSVQHRSFNLWGMLGDLTAMFRLRCEAKGLEFQFVENLALPVVIVADEGKFRQVLVNVLGNAVKFTRHGRVELQVEAYRNEDRQLRLCAKVTDTGEGIPAGELERLFTQFEHSGGAQKFAEGTGLGLAISREYARLMGGDITATSTEGRGSCFRLEIPIREGDYQDAAEPVNTRRVIGLRPGQKPVLVLLADDNAPNRNWVKQLLMLVGCQVLEAANGEEAVRMWEKWKPALILMDLQMPLLDGFEATRLIKAADAGGETVIIALTATVLEESRRAILAAGAADLLGKPMDESLLFDKMHTHLGIQFLHEAEPAEGPAGEPLSPEIQAASMARLPPALRTGMHEAIASGDLEGFERRLAEVAALDPAFAQFLRPLAEQYDYDTLLRLLNEAPKT